MEVSLLGRLHALAADEKLQLPILNDVALRLQALTRHEDYDVAEVERLIQSDQALAAEVLRAANAAFFRGLTPVETIRGAVVRIGIDRVARLVMLASEHGKYRVRESSLAPLCLTLWRHAVATSTGAQWLAQRLGYREREEEVFIAGLLHDIGKLVILRGTDLILEDDPQLRIPGSLILEVMDSAHTEFGAALLARWNIPEIYQRVAREHHLERFDPADATLLLVRLADLASRKGGFSVLPDPTLVLGASAEAAALNASDLLLAELEIALEDTVTALAS